MLAGAGLVAAALALALRTGGGNEGRPAAVAPPGAAPSSASSPSASPLSEVAARGGRARGGTSGGVLVGVRDALAAVDAPGSAALEQDAAFVRRLHAGGVRLRGCGSRWATSAVVAATGDGVTVEARVAASAYRQVRPDGTVVRTIAGADAAAGCS